MEIDFPYPGYEQIQPVNVPDANLMGLFAPRTFDHVDEERARLERRSADRSPPPHGLLLARGLVPWQSHVDSTCWSWRRWGPDAPPGAAGGRP